MNDSTPDTFQPATAPTEHAREAATGQPRGRCFAFAGADLLILRAEDDTPEVPSWDHLRQWQLEPVRAQYLGALAGEPCWSAELAPDPITPDGAALSGLRLLYGRIPEAHYALAGRAAQIVAWERDHQFCGRCGAATEGVPDERCRRCPACGLSAYPRMTPAIIVLIERGDQILLTRSPAFPPGRYGIVAGFVEPGETLEDAVRREAQEEVGLELGRIDYFGSQPWPYPQGIMIGFRADHVRGEITLNDGELAEAGWFGVDDLPTVPAKLSIARQLLDAWAEQRGFVIDQE
jgi:NAD+ diphosphatase